MGLSDKAATSLIQGLHTSNKDYLVKTFNLTEEEAEGLLDAWKAYAKAHSETLKRAPLRLLDSFVHGYLAHVDFTRSRPEVPVSSPLPRTLDRS